MEILGAFGVFLGAVLLLFLGLLAICVPYFVYSIHKHVTLIQKDVSRMVMREDAKPTIR